MTNELVEIAIKEVLPTTNGCAIFLGTQNKTFIIYVDPYIGNAIQMARKKVKKERPFTHDLMASILLGLETELSHVVINDREEDTYFARILLRMENELGKKIIEIDARPSDSMTLATQLEKPIYCKKDVFDSVDDVTELLERIQKEKEDSNEDSF